MAKRLLTKIFLHYYDEENKKVGIESHYCNTQLNHYEWHNGGIIPKNCLGKLLTNRSHKCVYVMYLTEENPLLYLREFISIRQILLNDYKEQVRLEMEYIRTLEEVYNANSFKDGDIVLCSHCGKTFTFDEDTCECYNGKAICGECYTNYYGTCNGCGVLHKYEDMNEDIYCSACQQKAGDTDVC